MNQKKYDSNIILLYGCKRKFIYIIIYIVSNFYFDHFTHAFIYLENFIYNNKHFYYINHITNTIVGKFSYNLNLKKKIILTRECVPYQIWYANFRVVKLFF